MSHTCFIDAKFVCLLNLDRCAACCVQTLTHSFTHSLIIHQDTYDPPTTQHFYPSTNMAENQEWKHGLFGCFNNCGVCLCSFFCPCIQFGRNVRTLGHGEFCSSCVGFACCMPCSCLWPHGPARTRIRQAYKLEEVCINDCVATCCCKPCSLAQEANEIETRGVPQTQTMG